jgi:tetratricopeptide (TPR) repeat protein
VTYRVWWQRSTRLRKVISAVLAVVTAIMLFVQVWDRFGPSSVHVSPMSGDYNVAVAEFAMAEPGGSVGVTDVSSTLAASAFEVLERDLHRLENSGSDERASSDFELRPPGDIGPVEGATTAERAEQAKHIAERYSADVVVYAVVEEGPTGTSMTPELYLTDHNLVAGAEELIGHYRLGQPLQQPAPISTNSGARSELRQALVARTAGLVDILVGLSYYGLQDYRAADQVFGAAEAEALLGPDEGAEVVHLLRGNVAGRLGELDAAEAHYMHALAINPDYARAQVGLAETIYQRAHNDCAGDAIDAEGVERARDAYRRALRAPDRPATSNVAAKVALGIGRADLCLSLAGVEQAWAGARQQFETVAADYESGNESIGELAAEAWSGLGLLEITTAGNDHDALERAADDLERAIAMTSSKNRLYVWYGYLGFAMCRLGRAPEATAAYDQAIIRAPAASQPEYYAERDRAVSGDCR